MPVRPVLLALLVSMAHAAASTSTGNALPQAAASSQNNRTGGLRLLTAVTDVYTSPDASAQQVARLTRGTRVELLNCSGAWCLVSFRGPDGNQIGYVPRGRLRQLARTPGRA